MRGSSLGAGCMKLGCPFSGFSSREVQVFPKSAGPQCRKAQRLCLFSTMKLGDLVGVGLNDPYASLPTRVIL